MGKPKPCLGTSWRDGESKEGCLDIQFTNQTVPPLQRQPVTLMPRNSPLFVTSRQGFDSHINDPLRRDVEEENAIEHLRRLENIEVYRIHTTDPPLEHILPVSPPAEVHSTSQMYPCFEQKITKGNQEITPSVNGTTKKHVSSRTR